jgi:hypothetical protein
MSCCNNTYNLGCYDSCSNLSIGVAEVSGTYKGIFTSGNNRITQTITVISGQPFVFDLRELNESATYSLSIYRNGVLQEITIDDIEYDCFSFKTQILGLDNPVTPIQGCTPFCQEIGIVTDDTLNGKGTDLSPLTVVGGGGGSSVWGSITGILSNQTDLQNALNAKQDLITTGTTAQYLRGDLSLATFPTNLSQFGNDVGFITNVITSLGYTPENVANKQTDLTPSATKYPNVNAVNTGLALKVTANSAITGATKTKITYDSKGLVTGGVDASLSELLDDATHRTVTDAQIAAWNALIGGSIFQSVWNASTNSPSLISSVGTKGFYYIVNVAGSTNLDGITDWKVGDWAIFDGTVWRKVDNTDAVSDVNGLTGSVVLDTSNVSATLNKRYVTDAQLVIIGNTSGTNSGDNSVNSLYSGLATSKQDTLVSGTNIKTINGTSLLGSGNIAVGASLSGLTAATATNTINNGAFTQEWQWNSQVNTPMLKFSSTSTSAVNGGNGLEINLTGSLVNANQTTYAAKFINTRFSTSGANSGAYFEGNNTYGVAIQTGLTNGGGFTGADIAIGGNGKLLWNNGYYNGSYIISKAGYPQFLFNSVGSFNFKSSTIVGSIFSTVENKPEVVIGLQSATRSSISFGGDNGNVNGTTYRSESVTSCIIERNLGKLLFSTNVGLGGSYADFTPTYQICVDGTNNNVAIGKGNTAGDASAKLEVVSTTQGFLPPRMTATQASAIASPAKSLIVYVTDTNGTFTSAGIWIYTTSWKLILAE